MSKNQNSSSTFAVTLLTLLIMVGVFAEVIVIPVNANGLAARYSEFRGDAPIIDAFLTGIVVFGQAALVLIILLLRRIADHDLLTETASRTVGVLMWMLLGFGATFLVLLLWLMAQNALPPLVGIIICAGILVSCSAALIVRTLREVLAEAIHNKKELQAVI
jgi:uncharacterized membrane protein